MNFKSKVVSFLNEKIGFGIVKAYPRHSIRFAKEYFKSNEINAVEIGTFEGYNAKNILKELNVQKIYLIDPYEEYEDYLDSEKGKKQKSLSRAERKARKRLKGFSDKIFWIKDYSDNALDKIPNDLDFIYIDGNHEYNYVIKDMENYYGKLRVGGILAGHDITFFKGVSKAFVEFCNKYNLEPNISRIDWWVVK